MPMAVMIGEQNKEPDALSGKTGNLGVILPVDAHFSNEPYFQECISGICEMASILDYNIMLTTVTKNDIRGLTRLAEKKNVDGIILTSLMEDDNVMQYLLNQDIMIGLTGCSDYEGIIQVDIDTEDAAETLTSFLIKEGYRKFAMITDKLDYTVHKRRYIGFCNAIEKNGLDINQQVFVTDVLGKNLFGTIIEDLLAKKVECIVCGDDIVTARVMANLQAVGCRIPEDIAVASLYNSANLDCLVPPVTTVSMSAKRMGNIICKQMIQCLEGKEYQYKTKVDYEILVRKSTGGFRKEK